MTAALIYASLERNTASVGLASVLCTSVTATNKEIASVIRHQDPASSGAAAINKQATLGLAVLIAGVGGDPQEALKSGTFAPGTIGDPTAKGNSCDDANDPVGCIFTQNLLVEDATAAEISAAVGSGGTGSGTATSTTQTDTGCDGGDDEEVDDGATVTSTATASVVTVTVQPTDCAVPSSSAALIATSVVRLLQVQQD
ncbi:hypothetical protein T439DRAFT_243746 [Meredithblackwellia eburnea MCA 4105]